MSDAPIVRHLVAVLTTALCAGAASALPPFGSRPSGPASAEELVRVELVPVDATDVRLAPGGKVELAVVFTIEPKWHIYWMNPGAAGMPTDVRIEVPAPLAAGAIRFPRPTAFKEPEGVTYGYAKSTALFLDVTAPDDWEPTGPISCTVDVGFLVCKDVCLMGQAERTLAFATDGSAGAPARSWRPEAQAAARAHRAHLPAPWSSLDGATLDFDGTMLRLAGPAGDHASVELYPLDGRGVTFGDARKTVTDGRFTIEVPIELRPQNALGKPMVLAGVVGLGADGPAFAFERPVETPAP